MSCFATKNRRELKPMPNTSPPENLTTHLSHECAIMALPLGAAPTVVASNQIDTLSLWTFTIAECIQSIWLRITESRYNDYGWTLEGGPQIGFVVISLEVSDGSILLLDWNKIRIIRTTSLAPSNVYTCHSTVRDIANISFSSEPLVLNNIVNGQ